MDQAIHAYVSRTAPRSGKSLELFDFATTIAAARTVTPEIARVLSDDLDVEGKLDLLESFGLIFRNGFEGEPSWYFAPSVRLAFIQIRAEQGDGFEDPFQVLVDHALGTSDIAGAVHYALDGRKWTRVLDILERHWLIFWSITPDWSGLRCNPYPVTYSVRTLRFWWVVTCSNHVCGRS